MGEGGASVILGRWFLSSRLSAGLCFGRRDTSCPNNPSAAPLPPPPVQVYRALKEWRQLPTCAEDAKLRQADDARFQDGVEKRQHLLEKRKLQAAAPGSPPPAAASPQRHPLHHPPPTTLDLTQQSGLRRPAAPTALDLTQQGRQQQRHPLHHPPPKTLDLAQQRQQPSSPAATTAGGSSSATGGSAEEIMAITEKSLDEILQVSLANGFRCLLWGANTRCPPKASAL